MTDDSRSDEEVAYHEAGHSVVAHMLGVVQDVTINIVEFQDGTQHGLTRHWIVGLDNEVQCRMAGGAATLRAFGSRDGADHDVRLCLRAIAEAHPDWKDEETDAYLQRMDQDAQEILDRLWRAVEAVAAALLTQRWLSGYAVQLLIREALA